MFVKQFLGDGLLSELRAGRLRNEEAITK